MVSVLYVLTAISSVLGGFVLLFTMGGSSSAPQQAAGAAVAMSLAVLPYVFARCVQIRSQLSESRQRHLEIIRVLKSLVPPEITEEPTQQPTAASRIHIA